MATLTDAADFGRKASKWVLVGLAIFFVLLIFLIIAKTAKNALFPPKPPPATVAFGKLPKLDISLGIKPPVQTTYAIETISGDLPQLSAEAKVFKVAAQLSSFGQLEHTKEIVGRVGFSPEPRNINGNIVEFEDLKEKGRILATDIASGNFVLKSNYLNDPEVISARPKTVDSAIEMVTGFFENFGISLEDFPREKIETIKYRIDGNNLVETLSISSANLVQVNFRRVDIDKAKVISPQYNVAPAWALVSEDKVVAGELRRLFIERHKFASYPLKGTLTAFEDLKAGKGAFNRRPDEPNFAIRNVVLAYLETQNFQEFLQPIYLFVGDRGLVAYVAAVADAWVLEATPPLPPLP